MTAESDARVSSSCFYTCQAGHVQELLEKVFCKAQLHTCHLDLVDAQRVSRGTKLVCKDWVTVTQNVISCFEVHIHMQAGAAVYHPQMQ